MLIQVLKLQVKLIAWTQFHARTDARWSIDADGGQALAEFVRRPA